MSIVLLLLLLLVTLLNFIAFVLIEIRIFNEEGAALGILGLFCGIYAYYWGWTHIRNPRDRTIMNVWTAGLAVSLLLRFSTRIFHS